MVKEPYPELPDNRKRKRSWKDIDNRKRTYIVLDEIKRIQSNAPHKAIYLQRLHFVEENREELRIGYYIIGRKPKMNGKWVWGQYAPLIPVDDFKVIIREAHDRGWI